jgi:uncharacterized protein (DUF1501 family)
MSELTRRRFVQAALATAPLVSLAPTVPLFLAHTVKAAEKVPAGRVLVVVELVGGNDGINTVVPFADEGYAKYRKVLRLPRDQLPRLNDQVGLHSALKPLADDWEAGHLAIIQGVSYPNPSRSHFVSREVWHTARRGSDRGMAIGWLGRALEESRDEAASGVFVGDGVVPVALRGRGRSCISLNRPEEFRLADELPRGGPNALALPGRPAGDDLLAYARRTAVEAADAATLLSRTNLGSSGARYPATLLGRRLQLVAQAIKAGLTASAYYLSQGNGEVGEGTYDTHSAQLPTHAGQLAELAGAWSAFLTDLRASRLGDRVAILAYSEFGREVQENSSGGTDHGTIGPILVAGGGVRGGLMGTTPRLLDLAQGGMKDSLDFRRVYATVLEKWLGISAQAALGGRFETLSLFR